MCDTTIIGYCICSCHNEELGNTIAELDSAGFPMPAGPGEVERWRGLPFYAGLDNLLESAVACAWCQDCHTPVLSSKPEMHIDRPVYSPEVEELLLDHRKKGGPNGQCQPDCPFCRQLDSIKEDHKPPQQ